jgi:hypothetical protein
MPARLDFAALFAFCDLHARRRRDRPDGVVWYDRQGWPIVDRDVDHGVLFALLADPEYRLVAEDELPDGSRLETTWAGFDHAPEAPPLFFETRRLSAAAVELDRGRGPEWSEDPLEFADPTSGRPVRILLTGNEEAARATHAEVLRRLRRGLRH